MQQSNEPKSKPQRLNKTRDSKRNKPDHNRRQLRENKRSFN